MSGPTLLPPFLRDPVNGTKTELDVRAEDATRVGGRPTRTAADARKELAAARSYAGARRCN